MANILEKLWGIGKKTAQKLFALNIKTIDQFRAINLDELSKKIHVRKHYLEISQSIANVVDSDFLGKVTWRNFTIAEKIWGVGRDMGILLYSLGVKDIKDITEDLVLGFPVMQNMFSNKLEKIKSQTQLALIVGLTQKNAFKLVKAGVPSLKILSNSKLSFLKTILSKSSNQEIENYIEISSKLSEANILNYEKAGNLVLAKKIKGIGPEIGALLFVLGMDTPESFISNINVGIRDRYLPWIPDPILERLIRAAAEFVPKNDEGLIEIELIGRKVPLTTSEVVLSSFHIRHVIIWIECGWEATQVSESHYPVEDNDINAYIRDAFRHCYWNCIMVRRFSVVNPATALSIAKSFADAHEDYPKNPANHIEMDLHNNEVGRKLAMKIENRNKPCEALVVEAITQGKLITELPELPEE